MDIEETIGMRIIKEVGVGLGKDNTETMIEGMTEVGVVDQVQEKVPTEIESDVRSVESIITLQETVQHQN